MPVREGLEMEIKAGRAKLNLLRKDINQIYNVGSKAVEVDSSDKINIFKAMYPRSEKLLNDYMLKFDALQHSAILGDGDNLFPTEEDFKSRNEINSIYYWTVQYFAKLPTEASPAVCSLLNKSIVKKNRLPKINLPKFNGTLSEWPKFKQLYISLIHQEQDIPIVEKFHYLVTSLCGDASSVISALTITENNYCKAWDALLTRYDNKRLLAANYVDKVLDFNPIKEQSLVTLQNYISIVGENLAALKSLNTEDEADFLKLSLALRKLDPETRQQFETELVKTEWPTYDSLIAFVQDRIKVLQLSEFSPKPKEDSSRLRHSRTKIQVLTTSQGNPKQAKPNKVVSKISSCCCEQGHLLYLCPQFRAKSIEDRVKFLKGKNTCFNCFNIGHLSYSCTSTKRCQTCGGRHHTLLHMDRNQFSPRVSNLNPIQPIPVPAVPSSHELDVRPGVVASVVGPTQVLLGTAEVMIPDCNMKLQPVRLVLDCGSQFSLITAKCVKRLGLSWSSTKRSLIGAGQTPLPKVKGRIKCTLYSIVHPENQILVEPLVVGNITGDLPTAPLPPSWCSGFTVDSLADPYFWQPREVDFLLGSDCFMRILSSNGIPTNQNGTLATIFGHIIMGEVLQNIKLNEGQCLHITSPLSNEILTRFWESEEVLPSNYEDPLDKQCEENFLQTHYRTSEGRYVVALPFKDTPCSFPDAKSLAMSRFYSLESKLKRNPTCQAQYQEFLEEYLRLGHMTPASQESLYVIPHHAVYKSHPEAKIRVVFDASMQTKAGSLNEQLCIGPKLQKDLTQIIMNFRRHKIAIVTDIVKMYRQILLIPEHRAFQHILWRPNNKQELQIFELNTITYGLSSSPYLALRTIQQLITDEGSSYPKASEVLSHDIYVDDIVSGADTLNEALELKVQLVELLTKGGFPVHKWASNSADFLNAIGPIVPEQSLSLTPKESCATKILGMSWDPNRDVFYYNIHKPTCVITKRTMLSTIARLFDPIGFLAPVVFSAKSLLQQLWLFQIDWDDTPPHHIVNEFKVFISELPILEDLVIPRYILPSQTTKIQIVGFADASEKGFAAVIYLRVVTQSGMVQVHLLKAKTKLAPIKTLSIPRLELQAANLLAKLFQSLEPFVQSLKISENFYFTDSTIVLAWLKVAPRHLNTFVANRVSSILSLSSPLQWNHVKSEDNPADVASRGTLPASLQNNSLWWMGPKWLYYEPLSISNETQLPTAIPEMKPSVSLLTNVEPWLISWMSQFSNFTKMLHTLAYVLRFWNNCKLSKPLRTIHHLSSQELNKAQELCIINIQRFHFISEFCFKDKFIISKRLQRLSVYLDSVGVLRVGGRLQHSEMPSQMKHPIILPSKTHFMDLMIDHYHTVNYHLGIKALQGLIQRKFWVFRLRQTIKARLFQCLTCYKMKARPTTPFMGNLPSCRVQQGRPFISVGIDYAGPFRIKEGSRRNSACSKAYLCLFVCMATKAVHLELVSGLSTSHFLAALDRFVARRGLPTTVFSDCGTNFVGASRKLKELYSWLANSDVQAAVSHHTSLLGFDWRFNPPYSPHFGGLWEAAVKSVKYHLYRVIGEQALTFEEYATLFSRIEAILNSRPLCPLSNDPEDFDFLSPGHFLIGAPLLAVPELDITEHKLNRLSRWQLIQNFTQHIWKRWHTEYLHTLHNRPKWYQRRSQIKLGDLVVLPDSSSLPLNWKLARITECFPGSDGIIRVVLVKTSNGTFKRSVHNIVPLFPAVEE